jgi:hypothetical protein
MQDVTMLKSIKNITSDQFASKYAHMECLVHNFWISKQCVLRLKKNSMHRIFESQRK